MTPSNLIRVCRRRWIFFAILAIVIVYVVTVLVGMARFGAKIALIHVGDSYTSVIDSLGEPMRIRQPTDLDGDTKESIYTGHGKQTSVTVAQELWYSKSGLLGVSIVWIIRLDKDGRVIRRQML